MTREFCIRFGGSNADAYILAPSKVCQAEITIVYCVLTFDLIEYDEADTLIVLKRGGEPASASAQGHAPTSHDAFFPCQA